MELITKPEPPLLLPHPPPQLKNPLLLKLFHLSRRFCCPNFFLAAEHFSRIDRNNIRFFRDNFKTVFLGGGISKETVPFSGRTHLVANLPENLQQALNPPVQDHLILPSTHPHVLRAHRIARDIASALRLHLQKDHHHHLDKLLESTEQAVVVVRSSIVNAGCRSDGTIVVFTGLLDRFPVAAEDDDAVVALVLCHEFGHAIARHPAEAQARFAVCLQLIKMFLKPSVHSSERIAEISRSWIPTNWMDNEFEADYIGILLFASAGYDPRLATHILREFEEKTSSSSRPRLPISAMMLKQRMFLLSRSCVMEGRSTRLVRGSSSIKNIRPCMQTKETSIACSSHITLHQNRRTTTAVLCIYEF